MGLYSRNVNLSHAIIKFTSKDTLCSLAHRNLESVVFAKFISIISIIFHGLSAVLMFWGSYLLIKAIK